MSAIQIAEQFEKHWGDFPSEVAAYMLAAAQYLRQQQAEIEALKKEAALQRLSDFTQEAEIESLKAENKFFKDLMGDVEILRKVQEK
jgi:cell shape-determining protein MreC